MARLHHLTFSTLMLSKQQMHLPTTVHPRARWTQTETWRLIFMTGGFTPQTNLWSNQKAPTWPPAVSHPCTIDSLSKPHRPLLKSWCEYFIRISGWLGYSGTDNTLDYFINIVTLRENLSGSQFSLTAESVSELGQTGLNILQRLSGNSERTLATVTIRDLLRYILFPTVDVSYFNILV